MGSITKRSGDPVSYGEVWCAEVGLPADPDLRMLYRHVFLARMPPSFADTALPNTTRWMQPLSFDRTHDEVLPDGIDQQSDRPLVYATLGTAYNRDPEIFKAILAALHDEPVNLIVTTGNGVEPSAFGPQPAHIRIEPYVPQSLLLPHCDLVITHGGSGTVMAALMQGVPMVMLPIAADQPVNAHHGQRLGVAEVIAPDNRTPRAIRAAVRTVLDDPGYRRSALALRQELEQLPTPAQIVPALEQLVQEHHLA